jgi:dTDP-glucose 4,6-dehydratase
MRIFITGATGFVGRHLHSHLSRLGHEIIALVHHLDPYSPFPEGAKLVQGSILDYRVLRSTFEKYDPDAVIHLAAQAIVSTAEQYPWTTWEVNVGGTNTLLASWDDAKSRALLLHFSTDKVYGEGLGKKETDSLAPIGVYESSKTAADMLAQCYMLRRPICITRACNIYGPGDKNRRMVPNVIVRCLRGESPMIYVHNGRICTREYIYIDDLCIAISRILDARLTGVWNIGSRQVLTSREVIENILRQFPGIEPIETPAPYREILEQSLDSSKFEASIGMIKYTPFAVGIRRTVEWWGSHDVSESAAGPYGLKPKNRMSSASE